MRLVPEIHPQWDSAVEAGDDQGDSRDFENSFKEEKEDDQTVLQVDHNIAHSCKFMLFWKCIINRKQCQTEKRRKKSDAHYRYIFPNSYIPCRIYLMLSKMVNLTFQLYFTCTCETEHVWRET